MKRVRMVFCLLVTILVLGGCQKEENDNATGPGDQPGTGTLAVRLMDAPAIYQAVNIVVDSVRVHVESGDTVSGWYTLSRSPATYNLLEYVNGKDTLIAEGAVPSGLYSQIRLYIGEGSNVVENDLIHPLEIPSGSQSGLKLNLHANILPGVKYVVTLDFDASRSIVVTGNGRYKLKPVIQTVATAVSGSLSGMVVPESTRPTVWAIAGTDSFTTIADATGFFRFKYLMPASYSLRFIPADTTYQDTTLTNVVVTATQNTDVGTVVLQTK